MRAKRTIVMNLRDLADKYEIIDLSKHLSYTEMEVATLTDVYIRELLADVEKMKGVIREQQKRISTIESPPLWTFGKFNEASPDFKREYMEKISGKKDKIGTKIAMVKEPAK